VGIRDDDHAHAAAWMTAARLSGTELLELATLALLQADARNDMSLLEWHSNSGLLTDGLPRLGKLVCQTIRKANEITERH
jgi:hypothetical protein